MTLPARGMPVLAALLRKQSSRSLRRTTRVLLRPTRAGLRVLRHNGTLRGQGAVHLHPIWRYRQQRDPPQRPEAEMSFPCKSLRAVRRKPSSCRLIPRVSCGSRGAAERPYCFAPVAAHLRLRSCARGAPHVCMGRLEA